MTDQPAQEYDRIARLADLMEGRLAELAGRDPKWPSREVVALLATKISISAATMAQRIEIDHHWAAGSVATILAGGDPTPLDGQPDWAKPRKRREGVPPDGITYTRSLTEKDLEQVVTLGRGIARLADLRDRLEAEADQLEQQRDEARARGAAMSKESEERRQRLFAVEHHLHREASQIISGCADGCCIDDEQLGYCEECRQSYPCTTVLVARGIPVDEARAEVRRRKPKPNLAAFTNAMVTP